MRAGGADRGCVARRVPVSRSYPPRRHGPSRREKRDGNGRRHRRTSSLQTICASAICTTFATASRRMRQSRGLFRRTDPQRKTCGRCRSEDSLRHRCVRDAHRVRVAARRSTLVEGERLDHRSATFDRPTSRRRFILLQHFQSAKGYVSGTPLIRQAASGSTARVSSIQTYRSNCSGSDASKCWLASSVCGL